MERETERKTNKWFSLYLWINAIAIASPWRTNAYFPYLNCNICALWPSALLIILNKIIVGKFYCKVSHPQFIGLIEFDCLTNYRTDCPTKYIVCDKIYYIYEYCVPVLYIMYTWYHQFTAGTPFSSVGSVDACIYYVLLHVLAL